MSTAKPDSGEKLFENVEDEIMEPPMFKVLLFNDDFSTKEFVVRILISIFNKNEEEAHQLMWHVHRTGVGVCGIYTREVAETKIKSASSVAREYGFPLKFSLESE